MSCDRERALALMIFLTARQCTIPVDPGAVTGGIKSRDGGRNRKRKVGERARSSLSRDLAAQFQAALWMRISDWAERTICIILPNWQAAGSQHGLCVVTRKVVLSSCLSVLLSKIFLENFSRKVNISMSRIGDRLSCQPNIKSVGYQCLVFFKLFLLLLSSLLGKNLSLGCFLKWA